LSEEIPLNGWRVEYDKSTSYAYQHSFEPCGQNIVGKFPWLKPADEPFEVKGGGDMRIDF